MKRSQNIGKMNYSAKHDSYDKTLALEMFTTQVLPNIEKYLLPVASGILIDVGCGNGRMNSILKEYFSKILCIDWYLEKIDPVYLYDNCEFQNTNIMRLECDNKVDCILFNYSFYVMAEHIDTMKKCNELLDDNGIIIINANKKEKNNEGKYNKDLNYDLEVLSKEAGFTIELEFIQSNGYQRTTILKRKKGINERFFD